MSNLSKHWQVAARLPPDAEGDLANFHPVLRQILYNRGYADEPSARQFIEARLPAAGDPAAEATLLGIDQSVERIRFAIQQHQPMAVYGDYDTDGVTATALLVECLKGLGAEVREYIPNRFDEGYGLNNEALTSLHEQGTRLVITVDCGIRSVEEADHARRLGLELIVSDHHHPAETLPNALAIINPKQSGDPYPDKDLAGVGLAYKLACALLAGENEAQARAEALLDLVALGTVADLAPLVGENRALVRSGIRRIRQTRRQGLMALIGVAGLKPERITASEIGFALGPRLNAAGRLESAVAAYDLLCTQDLNRAGKLAQELELQNRARQDITRAMQEQAEQIALAHGDNPLLLFAAHPSFNPGVVGLAAARLTEIYYRPSLVATQGAETTRGSCRSIPEFHITQALDQCADLLVHHGGHAAAAGFTVRNENLAALTERLQAIAAQQLGALDLHPTLFADVELSLYELRPELLKYLDWLQPTGYGNPQATFVSRNLRVKDSRVIGRDSAHLRLVVSDERITYDAIAFRLGAMRASLPPRVDLLYTFETNEYNGRTSLQLNVKDIKAAGSQ